VIGISFRENDVSSEQVPTQGSRADEIVGCAWELAHKVGIAGFSLRALAREVGIQQPSLYAHFESKDALYDAMFADGNRQLLARLDGLALPDEPRAALKVFMRVFVGFALEDTERCYLIFQRPVPGFEPSTASYGYAQQVMERVVGLLRESGVEDQADIDCFIAMVAGLIHAQLSNDPGGDRWSRHLERLADLYLDDIHQRRRSS
jgi:AcrR family transcriptional regulator